MKANSTQMAVPAEVISLHDDHQVTEVEISKIRTRFRLRTPKEEKIAELAESIKLCGLINPVTIDSDYYLLQVGIDGLHTNTLVIKLSHASSKIQQN